MTLDELTVAERKYLLSAGWEMSTRSDPRKWSSGDGKYLLLTHEAALITQKERDLRVAKT